MRKEKLSAIINATANINDLLFDIAKTNIFNAVKEESPEDMLGCVHYTIEAPTIHNGKAFKDFRVTINPANVCANKVLFTENIRKQYKVNACFEKNSGKNYFMISYKDIDTLSKIIHTLRDNYYEWITAQCIDTALDLPSTLTIKEKKKRTATKKSTTTATTKKRTATKKSAEKVK